jgi:hypothetical protein
MKKNKFRLVLAISCLLLITIITFLVIEPTNISDLLHNATDIVSEAKAADPYPPPEKTLPSTDLPVPIPPPTAPVVPEPEAVLNTSYVIKGWGEFSRTPVVAPAKDGRTLALYLVEGDQASQLLIFNNSHQNWDNVTFEVSPNGEYIAYLFRSSNIETFIGIVDIMGEQNTLIDKGAGKLDPPDVKAGPFEEITSLTWLDDQNILYTKVTWPGNDEPASEEIIGEIWQSSMDGKEQQLLATAPILRIYGASSDRSKFYVTRIYEDSWNMEGFAILDAKSQKLEYLWPAEEKPAPHYYGMRKITLADGSLKVLYTYLEQGPGTSVATSPPTLWLGDPETKQSAIIWTADDHPLIRPTDNTTTYSAPDTLEFSPNNKNEFIYTISGNLWHRDTTKMEDKLIGEVDVDIQAWTANGIFGWDQAKSKLQLLDEDGQIKGEISFTESMSQNRSVVNPIVDWDVPHIHQIHDTSQWFDGSWACGPTSAVMALAYFNQLPYHADSDDYGWYIPNVYTQKSACEGTHTYDENRPAPGGDTAQGAYSACTITDGGEAAGDKTKITNFLLEHDVGVSIGVPSANDIKDELDGGGIVILGTWMSSSGHILVVRGYTLDGFIVNDPNGDGNDGSNDGDGVLYTWNDFNGVAWYRGVYSPIYMPLAVKTSTWNGSISIQNTSPWQGTANLCFMNYSGSKSKEESPTIPSGGGWYKWFSDSYLFGSSDFTGSIVVVPKQPGMSAVTQQIRNNNSSFAFNGVSGADPANPGWGEVGTKLYAPVIMKNYYSWNSFVSIVNTGTATAKVRIWYYAEHINDPKGPYTYYIAPHQRYITSYVGADPNKLYSARIESIEEGSYKKQPLSAIVYQYSGNIWLTYNAFSAGDDKAYAPLIMNNYYGWNTSVNIQNVSSVTASGNVKYYFSNGSLADTDSFSIPPYESISFYSPNSVPSNFNIGSARISTNSSSQKVILVVNQSTPNRGLSYSGVLDQGIFSTGESFVDIPDIMNNYNYFDDHWNTSVNVQNLSESNYSNLYLYINSYHWYWIMPKAFHSYYVSGLLNNTEIKKPGFVWSIDTPIAVVVNQSTSDTPSGYDQAWSYTGYGR